MGMSNLSNMCTLRAFKPQAHGLRVYISQGRWKLSLPGQANVSYAYQYKDNNCQIHSTIVVYSGYKENAVNISKQHNCTCGKAAQFSKHRLILGFILALHENIRIKHCDSSYLQVTCFIIPSVLFHVSMACYYYFIDLSIL